MLRYSKLVIMFNNILDNEKLSDIDWKMKA